MTRKLSLRIAMPVVRGAGAGLANEMMPWAKAYIASRALGLKLLHPAWGRNARGYRRFFGTSRTDWAVHKILRHALPFFEFQESDLDPGESLHDAVMRFADRNGLHRRTAYVFGISGMWGGIDILTDARDYLCNQLLSARGTLENLYAFDRITNPKQLQVGIHIRQGDFSALSPTDGFQGKFNCRIPLDWYRNIIRNLIGHFGDRVAFTVFSDAQPDALSDLVDEFSQVRINAQPQSDLSDLIALSRSDVIVCSVSSYSVLAVFLGKARYLWLEDNLTQQDGYGSIWGHEVQNTPTLQAIAENHRTVAEGGKLSPRGIPVDWSGSVPPETLAEFDQILRLKNRATDLIRDGAVRLNHAGIP